MQHINNDIQEQRVGFPNAKLLKEKGFKVYGYKFYTPNGKKDPYIAYGMEYMSDCKCKADWNTLVPYPTNEEDVLCSAPTQQIVLDWILENFDLLITIVPDNDSQHRLPLRKYTVVIWRFSNGLNVQPTILRLGGKNISYFINPENAKEEAINHVLTKLI